MWLAPRQAHGYWEDPPGRRRCVSLPRFRPLGRWGTLPSFLPSAAEIPRDSNNRPPRNVTHRVQPTRSSVRESGTRPELGEPIVIEPTHIKRAPHRTVPKARGPRLNRQVKADLRYGRVVYLHTNVTHKTGIKMAPHRTVPKGRVPRLSRQVKADLRYGRGCLSPHNRHTQDWHTVCSLLGARDWNSPRTRGSDRKRAHTHKKGAA
jgi:hypothetical protein